MAKRGTPEHPKTLKLARMLGIEPWAATGLLECFWHWCSKYAITGEIDSDPEQIADGIRYSGDAQKMFAALVECRWLDCVGGRYFVHDVEQHADNTWKANLKRCGKSFATPSQLATDAVPTKSPQSKEPVTTKSQLSNEPPKPEPEPTPNGVSNGQAKTPDPRVVSVIDHLNRVCDRAFPYDGQARYVMGRLKTGSTVEQMQLVIDHRALKWHDDPKMVEYLRPKTLFNRDNWDGYLQEAAMWDKSGRTVALNGKGKVHQDWGSM